MSDGRALTVRQQKFVEGILDGKTQTAAAADAGYASPHVACSTVLKQKNVQNAIREALEAEGLTPKYLAAKLRELLEATDPDGSANWVCRCRAADMMIRLLGGYKSETITTELTFEQRLLRLTVKTSSDGNYGMERGESEE